LSLKRVAICVAQIPFVRGGAEAHVEGLAAALERRGIEVELVRLPFQWYPKANILRSCLAWRMLDLTESNGVPIDAVICTNFPSYVVAHPRKVIWLIHQHRQAYELFGTPYSTFSDSPEDQEIRAAIMALDQQVIGETQHRFANAANTARRLEKFNGLSAQPLHPPPLRPEIYRCGPPGDYILSVGRLVSIKRVDLLVRALAQTARPTRAIITGTGPELEALRAEAQRLGLGDRVEFAGWVEEERLISLYAGALGVFFAPYDEDFGYITLEAFLSGKPVLTSRDAGGPLELVRDSENGFVCRPDPADFAIAIDRLAADPAAASALGQAGRESVRHITWERTVDALLSGL
jgi:glycosyltransferase involved in cell wall biosynthesis